MRKLNKIFFVIGAILMAAMPVLAQAPAIAAEAGDGGAGLKAIAAGIGFAIAVFGGALGQSRIGAAACEGAAQSRCVGKNSDDDDFGPRPDRIVGAVRARNCVREDLTTTSAITRMRA